MLGMVLVLTLPARIRSSVADGVGSHHYLPVRGRRRWQPRRRQGLCRRRATVVNHRWPLFQSVLKVDYKKLQVNYMNMLQ